MRMLSYAVAVLAAAGLIVVFSRPTSEVTSDTTTAATVAETETTPVAVEGEQLVLKVPGMHCPHGCYPSVKETLTGLTGVKGVTLVKQANEDEINDPRVVVTVDEAAFDSQAAITALADAGFADSTVEATPES